MLLRCDQISERAREFVQDVMRDDRLQREGGDAIWNSVYHATVPGAVRYIVLYYCRFASIVVNCFVLTQFLLCDTGCRLVGFGLICASVGLGSLMLSPF